jgi:polyhydroxyalkanoate synthesis regulator phasin
MGNQLFQEARRFVEMAKSASPADRDSVIAKAKNALSSAYANSTIAEQSQLQEMQNELEQVNRLQ